MLPDDIATPERVKPYRAVIDAAKPVKEPSGLSVFTAPRAVRASASVPAGGGEVALHFVNYDRTEPDKPRSPGGGIKDEKPIEAPPIECDVLLPTGFTAMSAAAISPEHPAEQALPFKIDGTRIKFAMPKFLVYGVARIRLAKN